MLKKIHGLGSECQDKIFASDEVWTGVAFPRKYKFYLSSLVILKVRVLVWYRYHTVCGVSKQKQKKKKCKKQNWRAFELAEAVQKTDGFSWKSRSSLSFMSNTYYIDLKWLWIFPLMGCAAEKKMHFSCLQCNVSVSCEQYLFKS